MEHGNGLELVLQGDMALQGRLMLHAGASHDPHQIESSPQADVMLSSSRMRSFTSKQFEPEPE